jgi:hypothetical protein
MQQLQIQLSNALPYDLEEMSLAEYKHLDPRRHDWNAVKAVCADCATLIFDRIVGIEKPNDKDEGDNAGSKWF